jgi:type I restriction enzyme R subunit
MIRKPETIAFWEGRLPHWEVEGGRYFVTLHLAGAIPKQGWDRTHELAEEARMLEQFGQSRWLKVQRLVFQEMEAWLDRAEENTLLRQPEVARLVMEAVVFRQDQVWNMLEFVLMPTHAHFFFEVLSGGLKDALEQFKRWTGHQAARLVELPEGRFWQDEWFDHWSRSDDEDEKIAAYIRFNPEKAGLVEDYRRWPYGSWRVVR